MHGIGYHNRPSQLGIETRDGCSQCNTSQFFWSFGKVCKSIQFLSHIFFGHGLSLSLEATGHVWSPASQASSPPMVPGQDLDQLKYDVGELKDLLGRSANCETGCLFLGPQQVPGGFCQTLRSRLFDHFHPKTWRFVDDSQVTGLE